MSKNEIETVDYVEQNDSLMVLEKNQTDGEVHRLDSIQQLEGPDGPRPYASVDPASTAQQSPFPIPDANLVFDFKSLTDFERSVRESLVNQAPGHPSIGETFTQVFRKQLHDAALGHPEMNKRDITGLVATRNCLQALANRMQVLQNQHLAVQPAPVKEQYDVYFKTVYSAIQDKLEVLKRIENQQNQPPSLAGAVLSAAASLTDRLTNKPALSADDRAYYDRELKNGFSKLDDIASSLSAGIGNAEWESKDGARKMKEAKSLFDRMKKLAANTGDQLNDPAFRQRMESVKRKLDDAAKMAATDAFKKMVEQFAKEISEMVQKIVSVIFRRGRAPT